jgi:hypothetical protein
MSFVRPSRLRAMPRHFVWAAGDVGRCVDVVCRGGFLAIGLQLRPSLGATVTRSYPAMELAGHVCRARPNEAHPCTGHSGRRVRFVKHPLHFCERRPNLYQ